jgi:hypothetical protein
LIGDEEKGQQKTDGFDPINDQRKWSKDWGGRWLKTHILKCYCLIREKADWSCCRLCWVFSMKKRVPFINHRKGWLELLQAVLSVFDEKVSLVAMWLAKGEIGFSAGCVECFRWKSECRCWTMESADWGRCTSCLGIVDEKVSAVGEWAKVFLDVFNWRVIREVASESWQHRCDLQYMLSLCELFLRIWNLIG